MIQLGPNPEGQASVVMVTSASTGDGKTTSAVNLAAAAAASGDPVILLDFDLRKPDVGRTLGIQAGTELTGLLQPETQLRDLLSPAPGLPALSVLTTSVAEGDVALVEALSRRLPELIADARELCNYVVIDTAPIGEISDALRLVRDVDNIVVVTRPGSTNRANFEMMRDLLERTAYTPAGFLVIGDSTPRTSAYYAYGATGRELFLPAGESPASAEQRSPSFRSPGGRNTTSDSGGSERQARTETSDRPRQTDSGPSRHSGRDERTDRDEPRGETRSSAPTVERHRPPAQNRPAAAPQGSGSGRPAAERDARPAASNGPAPAAESGSKGRPEGEGASKSSERGHKQRPENSNGEGTPRAEGPSEGAPRPDGQRSERSNGEGSQEHRGGGQGGSGSPRRPARPPRSGDRPSKGSN
jgi:hypothetical protein